MAKNSPQHASRITAYSGQLARPAIPW